MTLNSSKKINQLHTREYTPDPGPSSSCAAAAGPAATAARADVAVAAAFQGPGATASSLGGGRMYFRGHSTFG